MVIVIYLRARSRGHRSAHLQPSPSRLPAKHAETRGETRCGTALPHHIYYHHHRSVNYILSSSFIYIYMDLRTCTRYSVSSVRARVCVCARARPHARSLGI